MEVTYTMTMEYPDDDAPVLDELDIEAAVMDKAHKAGIEVASCEVEHQYSLPAIDRV